MAHEALLRRPLIDGWLQEQKDALKLRDDVLREAKEWEGGGRHADGLVRRGERLQTAWALATAQDFKSALAPALDYLKACRKLERLARSRTRWTQASIYTLVAAVAGVISLAMVGVRLDAMYQWHIIMQPIILTSEQERELASKPGPSTTFVECRVDCPIMVVIPAGRFWMGSPSGEGTSDEQPQHEVSILRPFAVSRSEITFAEWRACVDGGGCTRNAERVGYAPHTPVFLTSWDEAKQYTTRCPTGQAGTTAFCPKLSGNIQRDLAIPASGRLETT